VAQNHLKAAAQAISPFGLFTKNWVIFTMTHMTMQPKTTNKTNKLKCLVPVVLALAAITSSPTAFAEVVAGTVINLADGAGSGGGGAFSGSVVSGASGTWNNSFQSFCVEYKEHISFNTPYLVQGVTNHTVNKLGTYGAYAGTEAGHTSTQDPISAQTAWLFTQFFNTGLSNSAIWGAGNQATKNTALQQAIWSFEGEQAFGSPAPNALASSYKLLADNAIVNGWSGIGNVRVLNLFGFDTSTGGYTKYAQDQLYMVSAVPEPETLALLLAGLGLVGAVVRRKKRHEINAD
jgi:hypothetical protein